MSMLFSGTLRECLDRLRDMPTTEAEKFRRCMDVHPNALHGWLHEGNLPMAEAAFRAEHYFGLHGWNVVGVVQPSVTPEARGLSRILSTRVRSAKELCLAVGWSERNVQALFRLLRGETALDDLDDKKPAKIRDLIAECTKDVTQREAEILRNFKLGDAQGASVPSERTDGEALVQLLAAALPLAQRLQDARESANVDANGDDESNKSELPENPIEALQALFEMIEPHARILAEDDSPEGERQRAALQQAIPNYAVVSAWLYAMTSVTTYRRFREGR